MKQITAEELHEAADRLYEDDPSRQDKDGNGLPPMNVDEAEKFCDESKLWADEAMHTEIHFDRGSVCYGIGLGIELMRKRMG